METYISFCYLSAYAYDINHELKLNNTWELHLQWKRTKDREIKYHIIIIFWF